MVSAWERELEEVNAACRRVPGLTSLLISLHPEPVYTPFRNLEGVVQSLRRVVDAAPTVRVEVMGTRKVEPVLVRTEGVVVR